MIGNSLILSIKGGLGNQMFQYAFSRALSIKYNKQLVIDDFTEFLLDKTYKRTFQLNRLNIIFTKSSLYVRLLIILSKIDPHIRKNTSTLISRFYGSFIVENNQEYSEINIKSIKPVFLIGYWQSPKYFLGIENLIRAELTPPTPTNRKFLNLGEIISSCNSVALGIRLYEETINPAAQSYLGKIKTIDEINAVIETINFELDNPRFFVFCTQKSDELNKLNLPSNSIFVTSEDGYIDAVDTMWLLSKSRNHIFMNSTFYWWGAFLSSANYLKSDQIIYAADNFLNRDVYCESWRKF